MSVRLLALPLLAAALAVQAQAPLPSATANHAGNANAPFDPARSLAAPTAYMVDLGSGRVLFERDADRRFMPASLTKIMTAYVAFDLLATGRLQANQRFVMSDAAFDQWNRVGSTMFIGRGQAVSVDELLNGIMTVSANDACIVLAEGAAGSVENFVALMNDHAARLGMKDTRFGNPNGWMDEGATYTTAHDLAVLTRAMIARYPAYYRRYVGHQEMTFNGIRQNNHVPVIGRVAGADGVKTGFTNEAGYGFVGSAARNGRRLVMVVGGYDRAWQRGTESRAFLEWGFSAWRTQPLVGRGSLVGEARVQGGAARHVDLVAPQPYYLTLGPGEQPPKVSLALRYEGPLQVPVKRGEPVAMLRITVPGEAPRDLPLVAAADVGPAGPLARLRNGLFGLVGL